MNFEVNRDQCIKIGQYLKINRKNPDQYYKFDNPKEHPDINIDVDVLSNFYGAVVNIDHHFWRINGNEMILDYGIIEGERIKGATYLWRKSKAMFDEDPEFFESENLKNISHEQFEKWLKDDTGNIPIYDPERRFMLTRNFGEFLLKYYDGNFYEIYKSSHYLLINNGVGFLERCEIFDGYRDSALYKKANLVAKIMERRGLWKFEDPINKTPPIDYHLQNVAIKSGMVVINSDEIKRKIRNKEFLNLNEELGLRLACKDVYRIICEISKIDPYYLDDDVWNEGRKHCQFEPPNCENAFLASVCLANTSNPELKEYAMPLVDTWRY